MPRLPRRILLASSAVLVAATCLYAQTREWKSGVNWPEPKVVTPGEGAAPPSDAIVLFDGKSLDAWKGGDGWVVKDGYASPQKGDITTKQEFGDCQLHIEFATPDEVKGEGQGRGNSGVFLCGEFEVQVLDSYENKTYFDGQCAGIYKQRPPLVNVCRKPGEWQTLRHRLPRPAVPRRRLREAAGDDHGAAERRARAEPLRAAGRHALRPRAAVSTRGWRRGRSSCRTTATR